MLLFHRTGIEQATALIPVPGPEPEPSALGNSVGQQSAKELCSLGAAEPTL